MAMTEFEKKLISELKGIRNELHNSNKIKSEKEDYEYSKAMDIIVNEFKEDQSPGSMYYGWQSNIACCIMDNSDIEHGKANEIAIKFLNLLTR